MCKSAWPFDMAANQHRIQPRACSEMCPLCLKPALLWETAVTFSSLSSFLRACQTLTWPSIFHPATASSASCPPLTLAALIRLHSPIFGFPPCRSAPFLIYHSTLPHFSPLLPSATPSHQLFFPPSPSLLSLSPRPTACPSLPQLIYHPSVSDWSGWTPPTR